MGLHGTDHRDIAVATLAAESVEPATTVKCVCVCLQQNGVLRGFEDGQSDLLPT